MYKATLGSKERSLQGLSLKRKTTYAKAVEQTLTLDYTASTFEGKKQFSLTVSNISLRPAAQGKPHTPFILTEQKQLYAEKGRAPTREEVLTERDTDPKLNKTPPSFSSYPLWEQQS